MPKGEVGGDGEVPGIWLIPAPKTTAAPQTPPQLQPDPSPELLIAPPPMPSYLEAPPVPAQPQGSGPERPRLVLLATVSLLLGASLTFGLAWVRGLNAAPPASSGITPSGGPAPIVVNPARLHDPAIAPEITELTDRGAALTVAWTDRSGGKASFVVVKVIGGAAQPLSRVAAGTTNVVLQRIGAEQQLCVAVVAVTETAQAASPVRCA